MTRTSIINTPCGPIQGLYDAEKNVNLFKGIRFATAGRFEYPVKVTRWDGIYQADTFGPACYQESAFVEPNPKDFYQKEFYNGETCTYSEDCLFLNIWAPKDAVNAPVLVYVHGGAFNHGYSYEKPFDGTAYCKKNTIVITVSYRLCALGYLALPELQDEHGHTGNYALFDLMTALSWIQDNIRSFGGDPDRVTLSGQSAGAMSVQLLCVSPLTDGLFHRAIMFSGGGVSNPPRHTQTLEQQYALGRQFMERLGVKTVEELKQIDVKELTLGFLNMCNECSLNMQFCVPVVDNYFLPENEFELAEKGLQKNIPYMIGTTSEDIFPELFHPMAEDWVKRQYEQGKQPSYLYYFSRQLPGDNNGAWHSADLWYVFGTLDRCWRPFTGWDYELSDAMVTYIANFVKTGNPNLSNADVAHADVAHLNEGISSQMNPVEWPAYGEIPGKMEFGNTSCAVIDLSL